MTATVPSLLQPLKDRLAAATPGPWEWNHSNPRRVLEGRGGVPILSCAALLYPERLNQEFIASAPTDQAKLIAAIEAADRVCADWANLSDGDKYYAAKIRTALTQVLGGDTA